MFVRLDLYGNYKDRLVWKQSNAFNNHTPAHHRYRHFDYPVCPCAYRWTLTGL